MDKNNSSVISPDAPPDLLERMKVYKRKGMEPESDQLLIDFFHFVSLILKSYPAANKILSYLYGEIALSYH